MLDGIGVVRNQGWRGDQWKGCVHASVGGMVDPCMLQGRVGFRGQLEECTCTVSRCW